MAGITHTDPVDPLLRVGPVTIELVERLYDMGAPPPRWGRVGGEQRVWMNATLPGPRTVEHQGDTLDHAARAIIDTELTASDKDQAAAAAGLGQPHA